MPISRYEIRNEFSLADPEVYRAADKDDPEALLEGVAMAGLVGVLRQLGDLAEFAAEVFHNLHEEVMATAARGHGLMDRVQQLETEIPSIEKAFLSQTDHSSFFNRAGVDWHPNLRVDQNLITQGDLPRFIMDSYEECRAPPRLFILDKFDMAGAGACLKRYTDPSFFKVENSGMTDTDIPREKKIRKAKKKGPRWRNGEASDVLPTSHTKLHQLFLEERTENVVSNPSRRVKLKRRLNGFPFDSKTGKSYMEKLLKSSSPDNKELYEVTVNSTPLMLAAFDHKESGPEVIEIRPVSRDRENVRSKRSPPSPYREEIMMNSSVYEPSEVAIEDKICEAPNSYGSISTDSGIASTLDNVTGEKVIAVDAESNRESSLTGYQSDDISSEVDNYMDAPSTMESETDAESRVKSTFTPTRIRNEVSLSDANEEKLQTRSLDSQSIGNSTISDGGNNSSGKEIPCSSSDSPSTSSYQKIGDDDFLVDQHSKPVISDDTCHNTDAITDHKSDYEQVTSSFYSNEFVPTLVPSESGVVIKGVSEGPESDTKDSPLDDEEKKSNAVMELPCSPSLSDSDLEARDYSPRSSTGEHLVDEANDESISCASTVPYIHYHIADGSDEATSNLVNGDESNQEDRYLVENNTNGTLDEMISSENPVPGKSDDEFPKSPDNFPSDNHIVQNGDNINSAVSKEENLVNTDNEDTGVLTDSPNRFPCFMETFLKKKLEETSSANAQIIDAEEHNHSNRSIDNQTCSEGLLLSNSPDWARVDLNAHEGDVIPEKDTTVNEVPKFCEVLGLLGTGMIHHVPPSDSEAQESTFYTPVDLKEPAETSGFVEMNETSCSGQERYVIDSGEDKSSIADMASAAPTLSDDVIIDDINKLVGEKNHFFEDSDLDELENDKSCLAEKVDQTKTATSGSETVVCDTNNNDHPISEASSTVPNSNPDLEVDQGFELVHPAIIQSPVEQSLLDREQEVFKQSSLGNQVSDAPSLSVNCEAEESIVQEEIGLLPNQRDQELPKDVSDAPSLPVNCEAEEPIIQEEIGVLPNQLDQELPKDPFDVPSEISNHDIDVPKDPFTETKQINLADLPPLPPLPPVQWRMGRFQFSLSSTTGETMNRKELFPQLISQPITSTDDGSSCPPNAATDVIGFSLPTALTNDDSFFLEEMKHSPIQIADEPASNEEKAESSCVEVNSVRETIDLPGKSESAQHFVTLTSESEFTSPAEEDGVANESRTGKLPRPGSEQQQFVTPTSESEFTSPAEEDGVANGSRTGKLPPPESEQQQFVSLTSESEFTSPAEEDGVVNGSQTGKLPRPRNPLIDEVAALDKSKLRKVSERVRPEIQKVDERDSLLEQIRAKSFNLKPALASRLSIRGPNTNLKVAAILEKANAIRQALAGSDEDDDDSWSDS